MLSGVVVFVDVTVDVCVLVAVLVCVLDVVPVVVGVVTKQRRLKSPFPKIPPPKNAHCCSVKHLP